MAKTSSSAPQLLQRKASSKSQQVVSKKVTLFRGRKAEFDLVFKKLSEHYPNAHCALDFETPFQLLIATILSAQCTDERVNIVTQVLFKKYPDALAMSQASIVDLEKIIHSTGFFRNKAKNIKNCCEKLVDQYQGLVPQDLELLHALPGVGRKTANVVLGNAFGIASGVVVDTHVTRLSQRFGWVKISDAVKIEQILNEKCPRSSWIILSHYLIAHGRAVCKARQPACETCFLLKACPRQGL